MATHPDTDALAGLDVSRETYRRLQTYEALLKKWNRRINLVAASTLNDIWRRHFADSLQLFEFAGAADGLWLDIGSGGGFPGAVVAIAAAERAPGLRVTCIESDIRKCEFLRSVARETGIQLGVLSRRIEDAPPQAARTLSARALGALDRLLGHAEMHLAPDGVALFLKGESWHREIDEARAHWTFDLETADSRTHPGSAILKVRNIARA